MNDSTRDNARVVGRVRSNKRKAPPFSNVPRETSPEEANELGAAVPPLIPRRPKRGPPTRETMEAVTAELQDAVRRLDALDGETSANGGEDDGEAF